MSNNIFFKFKESNGIEAFVKDFKMSFLNDLQKMSRGNDYPEFADVSLFIDNYCNEKESWKLETNASVKIKGSLEFQTLIYNYLKNRQKDINAHLTSKQQLQIKVLFEEKEMKVNDNSPQFIPVQPRFDFHQIILPDTLKNEITEMLNIIKYQNLIYKTWGFEEVDTIPKSVVNFYGPPGTGKTMTAHAIAKGLGKKLLALNYSEIESKYVGEAPKNLQKAFDVAQKEECVLFFDEADSFLGKRISNVSTGSEQALNSLRSQMLILMEQYEGIIIFATNLVSNFDHAFDSRILKHLKFELPNEDARIEIIRKMTPSKLPMSMPLTDDEYRTLSKIVDGFSGREIKNCLLDLFLAKATAEQENARFTFADFEDGFKKKKEELEKLKKERESEKKKKILNAIERQSDEISKKSNAENKMKKKKSKKR